MREGAEAHETPPRVLVTRGRSPLSAAGKLNLCQMSKLCFSVGLLFSPFYPRFLSLAKSPPVVVCDNRGTLPADIQNAHDRAYSF